jgi:hypothetical protein
MRSIIAANKSTRSRVVAASLGALLIASIVWIGANLPLSPSSTISRFQNPSDPERVIAEATYGKRYTSLSELLAESTAVVRGRIVQDSSSRLEGDGVAFTDAVMKVAHALHGTDVMPEEEIVISQTGGFEPRIGKVVEMELEPLMKLGEEYILFVHPQGPRNPGKWVVTGGYAGRFKIENGRAYRPTLEDPLWRAREPLSASWNGRPVASLEAAIRTIQ